MPVVLLVRHGQASFGAQDYDVLSALGRRQCAAVGAELVRRAVRDPHVAHGSLRRQRDTAALALPGRTPQVDPRWDEYDHLGLLARYPQPHEGPPPTASRDVQRLLDGALHDWVDDADGDWAGWQHHRLTALEDLLASLPRGRDAVVLTSGGVVAAIGAALLDGGTATVVALNRVAVNGAITTLVAGSSGSSLVAFNEHAHLDPADVTYR